MLGVGVDLRATDLPPGIDGVRQQQCVVLSAIGLSLESSTRMLCPGRKVAAKE